MAGKILGGLAVIAFLIAMFGPSDRAQDAEASIGISAVALLMVLVVMGLGVAMAFKSAGLDLFSIAGAGGP